MNTRQTNEEKGSKEKISRSYETPMVTKLPLTATQGGGVPTCDTSCEIADNTFAS